MLLSYFSCNYKSFQESDELFPCPAVYIPAKRNSGHLLKDPENYLYNVSKKRDKKVYYFCQKLKEKSCKVTVTVDKNEIGDEVIERRGHHNHESSFKIRSTDTNVD